jgi:hypothetical protein
LDTERSSFFQYPGNKSIARTLPGLNVAIAPDSKNVVYPLSDGFVSLDIAARSSAFVPFANPAAPFLRAAVKIAITQNSKHAVLPTPNGFQVMDLVTRDVTHVPYDGRGPASLLPLGVDVLMTKDGRGVLPTANGFQVLNVGGMTAREFPFAGSGPIVPLPVDVDAVISHGLNVAAYPSVDGVEILELGTGRSRLARWGGFGPSIPLPVSVDPRITTDGMKVVFPTSSGMELIDLHAADSTFIPWAGSGPILPLPIGVDVQISENGAVAVYPSNDGFEVLTIASATMRSVPYASAVGGNSFLNSGVDVTLSDDGTFGVLPTPLGLEALVLPDGPSELIPYAGIGPTVPLPGDVDVVFHADDRTILYPTPTGMVSLNVETKATRIFGYAGATPTVPLPSGVDPAVAGTLEVAELVGGRKARRRPNSKIFALGGYDDPDDTTLTREEWLALLDDLEQDSIDERGGGGIDPQTGERSFDRQYEWSVEIDASQKLPDGGFRFPDDVFSEFVDTLPDGTLFSDLSWNASPQGTDAVEGQPIDTLPSAGRRLEVDDIGPILSASYGFGDQTNRIYQLNAYVRPADEIVSSIVGQVLVTETTVRPQTGLYVIPAHPGLPGKVGEAVDTDFQVWNAGPNTVSVTGVTPSDGAFSWMAPESFDIREGEFQAVTGRYRLLNPFTLGGSYTLSLANNDTFDIPVTGFSPTPNLVASVDVPGGGAFGSTIFVGTSDFPLSIYFSNESAEGDFGDFTDILFNSVELFGENTDSARISTMAEPGTILGGDGLESVLAELEFIEPFATGSTLRLRVRSTQAAGPNFDQFEIRRESVVRGVTEFDFGEGGEPFSLDFGEVEAGQRVFRSFSIMIAETFQQPGLELRFLENKITGADVGLFSFSLLGFTPIRGLRNLDVRVTFTAPQNSEPRDYSASFEFTIDADSSDRSKLPGGVPQTESFTVDLTARVKGSGSPTTELDVELIKIADVPADTEIRSMSLSGDNVIYIAGEKIFLAKLPIPTDPEVILDLDSPTGIAGTNYSDFDYVDFEVDNFLTVLAELDNGNSVIVRADIDGQNRDHPVIENVTLTPDGQETITGIGNPAVSGDQIAFAARTTGGLNGLMMLLIGDELKTVADSETTVPGHNEEVTFEKFFPNSVSFAQPFLGFVAEFNEGGELKTGGFIADVVNNEITQVIESGEPVCVEGTNETGDFGSIFSDGFESGDISAWSISSPDRSVSVSRGKPDNCIKKVAETGSTPVPERGGQFAQFGGFIGFDDGRVLFTGTYTGQTGAGNGIYITSVDGGINKIVDSQDELDAVKSTRRVVLARGEPLSEDRAAFAAEFGDGSKTIYVADFSPGDFEIKSVKIVNVNGEDRIEIEYPSEIGDHFRIKIARAENFAGGKFDCLTFADNPNNPDDDDDDNDPTTTRAFKAPCSKTTIPIIGDDLYIKVERVE